jgi:hypothetical protein
LEIGIWDVFQINFKNGILIHDVCFWIGMETDEANDNRECERLLSEIKAKILEKKNKIRCQLRARVLDEHRTQSQNERGKQRREEHNRKNAAR